MTDIETASEASIDQRARRAAKRAGLKAVRRRWRRDSVDNRGGFQILDPYRNAIVGGERFDLSADDVIAFCAEREIGVMGDLLFFLLFLAVFYLVAALIAAASSEAGCDRGPPSKPEPLRPFDLMTREQQRAHLRPLAEKKYREAVKAAAREKRSVSEVDDITYAYFMSDEPLSNPTVGEALLRRLRAGLPLVPNRSAPL